MSREHDKQSVRCAGWEVEALAGVRCWRHLRLLQTHVHTDIDTNTDTQTHTQTHVSKHYHHSQTPTHTCTRPLRALRETLDLSNRNVFLALTTLISWRVQMNARADYLAWRVAGHCSSSNVRSNVAGCANDKSSTTEPLWFNVKHISFFSQRYNGGQRTTLSSSTIVDKLELGDNGCRRWLGHLDC